MNREPNENSPGFQFTILYSDGAERELQKKLKVEGGMAWVKQQDGTYKEQDNVVERWLTSGRTVYNNKGKPVKQYEPFYYSTFDYESEKSLTEFGVTPIIHYDPLERVVRTDTPKGFFSDTIIEAWFQVISDENDNVKKSRFYDELITQGIIPNNKPWTSKRVDAEKETLVQTESHANTPKIVHMDNMGRAFLEENSLDTSDTGEKLFTHSEVDISGNKLSITDPRQYLKEQRSHIR